MATESLKTLFHPFAAGDLDLRGLNARALFLGAEPGLALHRDVLDRVDLTCVQGFRPAFLALVAEGWRTLPAPDGNDYDAALVLAGRHRGQNELWIAEALRRVRSGGMVLVGGAKTDGIASLRKRLAEFVAIDGSTAKHHGLAFWLRKGDGADRYINGISQQNQSVGVATNDLAADRSVVFQTAPGMFSHEHVDAGSALLAEVLPIDLSGKAADFCSGWGYLSVALVLRAPHISGVDLYEADHASLEAARRNMAELVPAASARFFWHDLVREPVAERYDVIIMNPPFHAGRAAEPALGEALIRVAARALKPRGELYLVANRQLPYEATLAANFGKVKKLREEAGFKVFSAMR